MRKTYPKSYTRPLFKRRSLNPHWVLGLAVFGFLVGMFLAAPAKALEDQLWLDFNLASHHERDYWWREEADGKKHKYSFNQRNLGLGLTYGIKDYFDATGGFVIDNSFNKTSIYGGGILKYPLYFKNSPDWRIEPGVLVALATGYEDTPQDKDTIFNGLFLPYIIPNVTVILGDLFHARVGYVPDFDGNPQEEFPTGDRLGIWTVQLGVNLTGDFGI